MPEYLSPGVYVQEVETGAKAIEGVSTSTAAFLGEAERGPVEPQFLTSFADFQRTFGGYAKYRQGESLYGTNLAYAVDGFFRNGGSRCYVGRVTTETETGRAALGEYDPPLPLATTEDAVEFDDLVVDDSETRTVEIVNAGFENDPSITVTSVSVVDGTLPDASAAAYRYHLTGGTVTDFDLEPGQRQAVEVTYEPTSDGHSTALLRVDHTGADSPETVILEGTALTAENAVDVTVAPGALDFGTVPTGETASGTVTVTNEGLSGRGDVTVSNVRLTNNAGNTFSIASTDGFGNPVAPGESGRIEVEYTRATPGRNEAKLVFDTDVSPPTVETPLRAEAVDTTTTAGALGSSSVAVDFGAVPTGYTVHRTVSLFNASTTDPPETPAIDGFSYSGTAGTVEAEFVTGAVGEPVEPGSTFTLRISLTPQSPGDLDRDLTVDFAGNAETLTIGILADVDDVAGTLVTEPSARDPVDFGNVPTGESETRAIDLTNAGIPGAAAVDVVDVELQGADADHFSVPASFTPDPPNQPAETLEQGEHVTLPVTYAPPAETNSQAELVVNWSDGTNRTTTFALEGDGVAPVVDVTAVGPGEWGGRVAVSVRNGPRGNENVTVTVEYWTELADGGETEAEVVAAQGEPDVSETFDDLSTDQSASNYYETAINSGSNLVEVRRLGPGRPANGTELLDVPDGGGGDDELELAHFRGDESAPRGERTGLAGFAEIDGISIVSVPDQYAVTGLTEALVTHCESMGDRFAVLQAPLGADPVSLPPQTAVSEYAAIYYPHLEIVDPETSRRKLVPPGGHVAGIYARTDAERGVHKAPANTDVRGAVGLEVPVTKADQDLLNPKGVNAIRSFPGRGIRVWGARTTSGNPSWKYVNVRRLFLFLEESIEEGTQWAVFEPNDRRLWARVRQSVRNFLTTVWHDGGLMGASPDEAFYVKADRTTMTQDDIDKGRLIVEVGVAPVKPAEFVVFRITQWTEGVEGGS
ncbi:MAG: choice-of-anchor D domain-containing protein [Haloferacaceae archaeon]